MRSPMMQTISPRSTASNTAMSPPMLDSVEMIFTGFFNPESASVLSMFRLRSGVTRMLTGFRATWSPPMIAFQAPKWEVSRINPFS